MSKQVTKHKSRRLRRFAKANEAVSALEYAILVGVIAVAVAAGLALFSTDVKNAIARVGDKVADKVGSVAAPATTTTPF